MPGLAHDGPFTGPAHRRRWRQPQNKARSSRSVLGIGALGGSSLTHPGARQLQRRDAHRLRRQPQRPTGQVKRPLHRRRETGGVHRREGCGGLRAVAGGQRGWCGDRRERPNSLVLVTPARPRRCAQRRPVGGFTALWGSLWPSRRPRALGGGAVRVQQDLNSAGGRRRTDQGRRWFRSIISSTYCSYPISHWMKRSRSRLDR